MKEPFGCILCKLFILELDILWIVALLVKMTCSGTMSCYNNYAFNMDSDLTSPKFAIHVQTSFVFIGQSFEKIQTSFGGKIKYFNNLSTFEYQNP